MRRAKPGIVRHWRRAWAGQVGGQSRGADRRLALRARQVVETIVFRFGARFVAFSLVACASRPETGFLSAVAYSPPGAVDHTLLVATTRERDDRPGTLFNGDRAMATSYAELTVSVPPNHKQGEIEWATTPPGDPNVDYVVRDEKYLDGDKAFVQALNAQLALRPPGKPQGPPVHSWLQYDVRRGGLSAGAACARFESSGVPVLFTWASRGKPTAYVYDLNSATAARDGLEHTLRLLLASNAEEVNVLAHSMGNWVTVEAFRQIKISGDLVTGTRSATSFSRRPISTSTCSNRRCAASASRESRSTSSFPQDDRALFLSRTIAGGVTRVGDNPDVDELASLGATVIDLTDLKATDATNHDKFAQLATVGPELRGVLARGIPRDHQASDVGQTAVSGVGAVVSLPLTILGAPIKIIASQ